jgi:hypothetical protein
MGGESKDERRALTQYLKLLGNPYAKLSYLDPEENESPQGDLELRPPTEAEREYARLLGNQYALLSVALKDSSAPTEQGDRRTTAQRSTSKLSLSKEDFENECRRIFRQYIPAVEKGRLRRHHKEFIARNQSRGPIVRHELVEKLRRYDIAGGVEARFNREREDITDAKLRKLELSVLDGK